MERKLDFLIIGAQKAGTTFLHSVLRQHTEIFMPPTKEQHYFDRDELYKKGFPDYHNYHRYFKNAGDGMVMGEATPAYLYLNKCVERIHQYNSSIKMIAILRNPIERAYSHWQMEFRRKQESYDFYQALRLEKGRLLQCPNRQHMIYSYVDRGYYMNQIERFLILFPKKQLLILLFEDLISDITGTVKSVCDFLKLSNNSINIDMQSVSKFEGSYREQMSLQSYEFLVKMFTVEIQRLQNFLGCNLSHWFDEPFKTAS